MLLARLLCLLGVHRWVMDPTWVTLCARCARLEATYRTTLRSRLLGRL